MDSSRPAHCLRGTLCCNFEKPARSYGTVDDGLPLGISDHFRAMVVPHSQNGEDGCKGPVTGPFGASATCSCPI